MTKRVATEKDYEKIADENSDKFVYIYNENSKSREVRVKVDKLSKEEMSVYLSMKGINYNKEKGYISFNEEFENKEFYNSMKDIAILSQFYKRENISDEEKKFIRENAPGVYDAFFPFERDPRKKEEIKEKTDKNPTASKIGEFLGGLIVWGLETRVRAEVEKAFGNTEIITTKDGKIYSRKDLDKDLDEDIEPPKPLPLK